jgi:hypothetical protein
MGEHIIVNTVKIGHARMMVDAKVIQDQVYQSNSEDAIRLRDLLHQKKDVESALSSAAGKMRTDALKSQLGLLQKQIDHVMERIGVQVTEQYGRVYVEIDDIPAAEMFSFPEDKVQELEQLAEALLEQLREEHQVEDIKRAAVLYDHLYLLMQYNKIDAPRLEKAARELENMLDQLLNKPTADAGDVSISDMERIQLRNMLEGGIGSKRLSLGTLLRMLWIKAKRWLAMRRQMRSFAQMTGKIIKRRR